MIRVLLTKLAVDIDAIQYERLLTHVSDDKKKQIMRYHYREDALRCLLGELLLIYGLRSYYELNHYEILLNLYGKPYLNNCRDVFFNKTHSGEWIACAFDNIELGLDLEQMLPMDKLAEMQELSQLYMTEDERAGLRGLAERERMRNYIRFWTRKEAQVKCQGVGIGILNAKAIWNPATEIMTESMLWDNNYELSIASFQKIEFMTEIITLRDITNCL